MKKVSIGLTAILVTLFLVLGLAALPSEASAAVVCSGAPSVPGVFWAKSGPKKGQVTLTWNLSTNVDRYHLVYGLSSGNYQYGARRIGNENSWTYTVGSLESGRRYYFKLSTNCGGTPTPSYSKEVSGVAL